MNDDEPDTEACTGDDCDCDLCSSPGLGCFGGYERPSGPTLNIHVFDDDHLLVESEEGPVLVEGDIPLVEVRQ